jgi:hypothetical protein
MRKPRRFAGFVEPLLVCGLLAASGCYGKVIGPGIEESGGDGVTPPPPGTDASGPVIPGDPRDGSVPSTTDAPKLAMGCSAPVDPGPVYLRRLTHAEYRRTIRDLTGIVTDFTTDFPPETSINGYRNNAEGIPASTLQTEKYDDAATKIANELIGSTAMLGQLLGPGCALTGGGRDACLDKFTRAFGLRVFRRPLAASEVARYLALAKTADADPNPNMSVALVLRAMLQSPHFLYRIEAGGAGDDPANPGWKKLDGYEIATRLSFLLWGTTPDTTLLDSAANKGLDTLEGVRATTMTLLANDQRAKDAARDFYSQWLGYDIIPHLSRDATEFPRFSNDLRLAMAEEARLFTDSVLWEPGATMAQLLDADYSFLNPILGNHYGKPIAPGAGWTRVTFDETDERGGLLGLGGVLAATWKVNVDPILRGKFVREGLLCQPPPPPPPNVGNLPVPKPGESERQRLQRHRENPACSGCHNQFDPIGFGLERYDGIGRLRTVDSLGQALTGQGTVEGVTSPDFVGMRELAKKLATMPEFSSCTVTQMFRYAFARSNIESDACAIEEMTKSFTEGGLHYKDLILAVVSHPVFRYRRADAGEKP